MGLKAEAFSKRGLRDWQMQRITAVLTLLYFVAVGWLLFSGFSLANWKTLFSKDFQEASEKGVLVFS